MLDQLQQIIADQETSSDKYATRFSGKIGQWFLQIQSQKVLDCLASCNIKTVLEIGGGHGQLVNTYLKLNIQPTIYSSDPICASRVQYYIDKGQIKFETGNLIKLPYPDKFFDAVVSIRLLAHCPPWDQLISEMCRVSKNIVIVDYPPLESFNVLYDFLYNIKAKFEGTTRPFTIFKNATIRNAFNNYGFKLYKNLPQFFMPMVVYRKLKSVPLAKLIETICSVLLLTKFLGSPTISCFKRKP